ncbi:hypothetical protein [Streptomyces gardneri]|uniref:hypothetical protein n=1 Tax=Streptomyces gardneri TaxID=66892 RepID=UPI0036B9E79A
MATVEYHYVLTLTGKTGPDEDQTTVGTRGVVDLDPATTSRDKACEELVTEVQSAMLSQTGGLLNDPNIVYFSLEPNQL